VFKIELEVIRTGITLATGRACGGWTAESPGGGEAQSSLGHVMHFATHPKTLAILS
jgi:hypothetical protein